MAAAYRAECESLEGLQIEDGIHLLSFATGDGECFDERNEMGLQELACFVEGVNMDGIRNHRSFFQGKVTSGTHRRRVRTDRI